MGLKYLWDTNTVIYYFNKHFPPAGEKFIDDLLIYNKPSISVITEIELLCWQSLSKTDFVILKNFINEVIIYELDRNVKVKTIEIRKYFKLKLPDAIIASSAIVNDRILISRNLSDFGKIPELELIDPFNLTDYKV
jgi:predicted nucleic acid-binding protein